MMLSLATLPERDGTLTRREFMGAPAMPAAIEGYRRALDRNPYGVVEQGMFKDEARNISLQVRGEIADYLGGRAEDICLTRCTTEGLALVYHGLPRQPGDEVLTTTHDHYLHHKSIALATARVGATM
jgi:isopenicillin-N epimerase